ncbi:MAG TPA: prepilin-type N-terminal cleavage/methylation domain-containing protein [Planctomycetota bacterium]|jgi:prepilin-type N-terminal cleavage/methylation domain-containing protein|nr:prepilin-type N-terminal cleavage/methylation domain-containing protein [Planctomycetota bacterium]OQC20083.1 MAG: hypothetical protein BWX69_02111 [Planctomycetes bacterium ADurb.Bin069]NMD36557.1 prepilin-type N-terminal cleavage/methylation domain-containing protein [Planctomycetota bacterium]HNS00662.1 prepilin-type N-terminal cleavage/methylation domain-containing protein [Planctomycetota bacterium]HNU26537.1 prepilin-type N-terminal cleavage/methylation domain-containing protein [Planc
MTRRGRGFTLFELLVVLVVVGLIAGIGLPRLEALSPKYSLRAAARAIATELEYVRSTGVFQCRTYGMRYDIGRNVYYMVLPPEEDAGDIPFEDWPISSGMRPPALIAIKAVVLADNSVFEGDDIADVVIDPLGAAGSHVVILTNTEGQVLSVKFNALTGTVDFFNEEVGFARFD